MKTRHLSTILVPVLAAAALCAGRPAGAKPEYLDVLTTHYKAYAGPLTDRSCANCHVSTSDFKLNPYGQQIAHELDSANTKTLTASILQKVEPLDANGNGVSNLDEIKAGKAPGAAVPGAHPAAVASATGGPGHDEHAEHEGHGEHEENAEHAEESESAAPHKSLIPKNFFHPAIVHFPIALFLGGLLLDLVGYLRGSKSLLAAGWYDLVLAAFTTLAALLTGYVATLRMHVPITGLIQEHMLLALGATAIMWVLVALRARRHENMSVGLRVAYYVLAVACVLLISYSGHLGGQFVYGE